MRLTSRLDALVGAACVASLLAVLAARADGPPLMWCAYLASLILAATAAAIADHPKTQSSRDLAFPRPTDRFWYLLVLLLAGAFALRTYHLASLPEGLWFDEATNGVEARRLLHEADYHPLWIGGSYGAPSLHAYLIAAAFQILGETTTAIRSVSVAFGMAAVGGAALVGYQMWGRRGGLLLAGLVGLSRVDVTLSRIGMHNASVSATLSVGLGLVLLGVRTGRRLPLLAGGMVLGFGVALYPAALPGAMGALALSLTVGGKCTCRLLGTALLGLAVVLAPYIGLAIRDPALVTERGRQTSVFNQDVDDLNGALAGNVRAYTLSFHWAGDRNGRHNIPGEPLLDPVTGVLSAAGIGLALWRRHRGDVVLVGWLALSLVPGVLSVTFESPNALRAIGAVPALQMLAALPLVALGGSSLRPQVGRVLGASAVAAIAVTTVHLYFDVWKENGAVWAAHSMAETVAAGVVRTSGPEVEVHVISTLAGTPTMAFLSPSRRPDAVFTPDAAAPLAFSGERDAVVVVDGTSARIAEQLLAMFPGATAAPAVRDGIVAATTVRIPRSDLVSLQGLAVSSQRAGGRPQLLSVDRVIDEPSGASAIVSTHWSGLLVLPGPEPVEMRLLGGPGGALVIDGEEVAGGAVTVIGRGVHAIGATARQAVERVVLEWRPPGGAWTTVPPAWFWRPQGATVTGLAAEIRPGDQLGGRGSPSQRWIDLEVGYTVHEVRIDRPNVVRWRGWLVVTSPGRYQFGVETPETSRLTVDAMMVAGGGGEPVGATRLLDVGWHAVELEVLDAEPFHSVRLWWTPPDAGLVTIPTANLRPPWITPPG